MDPLEVTIENVTVSNSGTSDFDALSNRPSYNGTQMTHSTNIPEVKTDEWDGKVDKTTTVNGQALSSNVLLDAGDINVDESAETKQTIASVLSSQSSQIDTLDDEKEDKGKMTVGSTEYSVTRKALVITDGSTTTTYYVADITA